MSPTVVKLLEAFLACQREDDEVSQRLAALGTALTHVRQQVDYVRQQDALLLRLMRQLLQQTPDPAQVAALGEEIGKLEAASAHLTDAMQDNP